MQCAYIFWVRFSGASLQQSAMKSLVQHWSLCNLNIVEHSANFSPFVAPIQRDMLWSCCTIKISTSIACTSITFPICVILGRSFFLLCTVCYGNVRQFWRRLMGYIPLGTFHCRMPLPWFQKTLTGVSKWVPVLMLV